MGPVEEGGKKAVVIYSSHFGSTEKIAKALASGLTDSGLVTACLGVEEADPHSLTGYSLLCLGAPTEAWTAHRPMKDFLASTSSEDLAGRLGFAFDTRIDSRLSGSAAKYIEQAMERGGFRRLAPRESAIVRVEKKGGMISGSSLREGEVQRFHDLGVRLGRTALSESSG